MRRPATIFALSIALIASCCMAAPVDYYVDAEIGLDANDGSESSPWQTITHALDSVEGSEATPVTIHVAAGTY
ncbi:MAG: DUF1565 domain-containing protein, partial [Candidatus Coatesbacteria bacterium]|nr:DUF1565 domain-containing protein [Candidatus Coatesbacteria bacterium]